MAGKVTAGTVPTGQNALDGDDPSSEPVQLAPSPAQPPPAKGAEPAPDMLWREHEGRIQALEKREPPAPPTLPAAPPLPGPQDRPGGRLFPDFVYELLD